VLLALVLTVYEIQIGHVYAGLRWERFYSASGMDRWTALSMLETGDNDNVIGSAEISRFQIRGELWPVETRVIQGSSYYRQKRHAYPFEQVRTNP